MRDTLFLILFISILFLIGYSYIQTEKVYKLKAQIATYEAHRDTIYVEGKQDTVFVKKSSHIAIVKEIRRNIDTTLDYKEHTVKIKLDTLTKKLLVDIECKKPEIIIKQIDTIKIPVMKTIEVETKQPFYETKEFGFLTGILIAYLFFQIYGG